MRSDAGVLPVAIVGGGFSGTMTAVQLSRRGIQSILIDGSGQVGRGVAYSTTEDIHLLNVPSSKMSAWPDQLSHFAEWLEDDGTTFAERRAFGRYVGEQLASADGVQLVEEGALAARRDKAGWTVRLASGEEIAASALVLANGNQPPAPMALGAALPPELFANNPWSEQARRAVQRLAEEPGDALILGTGLTMIDTVLSLVAAGHSGRIVALSRRGLIPRAHAAHEPSPVEFGEVPTGNLLALWRWLRRRSATVGFRAAVDALRPHSQALWQALPDGEQRRFLRHARPWWDVHRHRIAPQIARQLQELIAAGQLTVIAGRVRSVTVDGEELVTTIVRRGEEGGREHRFAAAFNCTGPLGDMRRTDDALLRQLLADRIVQVDRVGMGIEVDGTSRAADGIWALGPLTKGRYWEIVAVPDIRGQAAAVAADIAQELEHER
jgi:uncharacterized NAD(P)/FAD-binding protein YdhS